MGTYSGKRPTEPAPLSGRIYLITHPEVTIDRMIPMTEWDLSAIGRQRLEVLVTQPWMTAIDAIFASTERKARTTAEGIATVRNLPVICLADLAEKDRSSTGFLEPNAYRQLRDAFFAHPTESIQGWERAVDAQARILRAIEHTIARTSPGTNVAVVSHGGVGTLLLNHVQQTGIRKDDLPPGQGYYFVFTKDTCRLIQYWKPIDSIGE
jgi:broad specificity phosphatase PhoE